MAEQIKQENMSKEPEPTLTERVLGTKKYTEEDMTYGQSVIIMARWILVFFGFALAIWNPDDVDSLRYQVLMLILLAIVNFNLQAQLLKKKKTSNLVWYAASVADLVVITLLIAVSGGMQSNDFVFYFPAILAFSVAFPTIVTFFYLGLVVSGYFLVGLLEVAFNDGDLMVIVMRMLMFVAVGVSANLYFRIEADRRNETRQSQERLMDEVKKRRAVEGS